MKESGLITNGKGRVYRLKATELPMKVNGKMICKMALEKRLCQTAPYMKVNSLMDSSMAKVPWKSLMDPIILVNSSMARYKEE